MGSRKVIHLIAEKYANGQVKTRCGITELVSSRFMAVLPTNPFQASNCLKCRQIANGMKKKVSKFER